MSPSPKLPALLLKTQSDSRLASLARDGHEPAFEAIVERYRKPLLARCKRMLSSDRAEDAVQQTFLGTWKAIEQGTEIRDIRAWLYRSALNHSLNAVKAAGYDYAELHESLAGGIVPEADAERKLVMRETLAGIAALPERQREALLKTAVEGRSHAEVAQEFGMSDTAVRQLVRRARVSLRAAATALTPMPLVNYALAAASQGGGEASRRIVELAAGAGGAGAAGMGSAIVKGGAVVAVVAAVATPGGIGEHAARNTNEDAQAGESVGAAAVAGDAERGEQVAAPAAGLPPQAVARARARGHARGRAEADEADERRGPPPDRIHGAFRPPFDPDEDFRRPPRRGESGGPGPRPGQQANRRQPPGGGSGGDRSGSSDASRPSEPRPTQQQPSLNEGPSQPQPLQQPQQFQPPPPSGTQPPPPPGGSFSGSGSSGSGSGL